MARYFNTTSNTKKHVQILLTLGALVAFVLGAGAPAAGSGGWFTTDWLINAWQHNIDRTTDKAWVYQLLDSKGFALILLVAIMMGLLAGLVRARYHRRPFVIPELRLTWLATVAFLPQWLAFFFAPTRHLFTDRAAALALVASQILLSGFGLLNRQHPAMRLLTTGLCLNLAVIGANGGLMPISPETIKRLMPNSPDKPPKVWQAGQRFGKTKDRILPESATLFAWLSDRFIFSTGFSYRVAYSIGDVLIAAGAFWLLWSAGGVTDTVDEPHESMN